MDTYELLATQWAAVMTHESEISDPPQINPPLRFRAICYRKDDMKTVLRFSALAVQSLGGKASIFSERIYTKGATCVRRSII